MNGYIFRCNSKTEEEVFERHLLGEEAKFMEIFKGIKKDDYLFLYNCETFQFFGSYKPVGEGGTIEPKAWGGKFPSQVRFKDLPESTKVPFSKVADLIKRWHNDVFPWPELSEEQTKKILELIKA